jgi:secondary thiamine-phosphate synthase enzyme
VKSDFASAVSKPQKNGNGKPHVAVVQNPELRAQGLPGLHMARLVVETHRGPEFIDITETVQELVTQTKVREGSVLVYSRHTTAGIVIQENEPLLIQDMYRRLEKIASPAEDYEHNNFDIRTVNMCDDECANGHAHCQHLFVGCSEHIPILDGHLALGRWQRLFVLEMDRPRTREILVQITGI